MHILKYATVPLKWTEIVTYQVKGWLEISINIQMHISLSAPDWGYTYLAESTVA